MLAPAVLVVGGLFGAGLAVALLESVGWLDPLGPGRSVHVRHYIAVAGEREFRDGLLLTLWVAGASTVAAVAVGLGVALSLFGLVRGRRAAYAVLQVPLGVPHLVIAVAFVTLLAPSGWVARLAFVSGIIASPDAFPALVYDRFGIGIILAYLAKEVPFLAITSTAMLLRIDSEYGDVARTLGASPWQRFRYVTWPLVRPGVTAAGLMVFAFVFAAFDTPFILGRAYPSMLAVVAERRFLSPDLSDRPEAVALALIMTALASLIVVAYLRASSAAGAEDKPVLF